METIGDATLYLGDCREIMPTLPSVDAVVTDPPYGVREEQWDDMTEQEFACFTMSWIALAPKLAPELITFGNIDSVIGELCRMAFPRVRKMIWAKPSGSQLSGGRERTRWFAFEAIFHCYTEERWSVVEPRSAVVGELLKSARVAAGLSRGAVELTLRGKKTGLFYRWEEGACLPAPSEIAALKALLNLGAEFDAALAEALTVKVDTLGALREKSSEVAAGKSDVLTYRTVTNGSHPTEKPLQLLCDLIDHSGGAYRCVADPFMGSGTTGVAALKLGKRFIGIEAEPRHFDTACRRIEEAWRQPRLFAEPPSTQGALGL